MNAIKRNAIYNMIYNILNMLFPLITAAYVSRVLFADGVGLASFVYTIASYFVVLAPIGIPTYGIKTIAQAKTSEERSAVYSELLLINSASTIILAAAYYLMVFSFPQFKEHLLLYCIAGLTIVLNFLNNEWLYRGLEKYKYITVRNFVVKILSLVATFVFVKTKEDVAAYLIIICVVPSLNRVFNIIYARKSVKFTLRIAKESIKKHLKPLFLLSISEIAVDIYMKMDVTMLGIQCQSQNVGYYSSAMKIVYMGLVAITSITAVSLPRLSTLYEQKDKKPFFQLISDLMLPLLVLSFAACVGLCCVADDVVVLLLGAEFLPSANILRILSLLLIIKGIGDLLAYQTVIAMNREKIFPPVRFVSLFLNFGLNYFLIKQYAHNGAAMATVLTELFTFVSITFLVRKDIRLFIDRRDWISIIISCLIMVGAILVVNHLFESALLRLICSVLGGAAIYFASLFVLGNSFVRQLPYHRAR